jgi:5-methyltetrahydropteroyltriglutamate--homocysteine methyltransferase
MKLSTDRILTTHVGSLPRPQALVELLIKKDHGEAYDHSEFATRAHQAVADIVARQVSASTLSAMVKPARSATRRTSRTV